jgi:hypothetical protein
LRALSIWIKGNGVRGLLELGCNFWASGPSTSQQQNGELNVLSSGSQ